MDPDIIIYINKLREYFKKNEKARDYFLKNLNEDKFFDLAIDMAQKNFSTKGDPTLDLTQFEAIKQTIKVIEISKRPDSFYEPKIFIDTRGLIKTIKQGK